MRMIVRACAALTAFLVAAPLLGAAPQDFYLNLLRRGVADFNAGRFDAAKEELRIAAFGLVETIDSYQTAHVYLALAADRLGDTEEARRAVGRVQAAQRVQARYAALPLPAEVRSAFDALVQRVAPAVSATLRGNAPAAVASNASAAPPRTVPPAPATTIPATTTPVTTTPTTTTPDRVVEREIPVQDIAIDPPRATTTTTTTTTITPPKSQPQPQPPAPKPQAPPAARGDLAAGERALDGNDLVTARAIFRQHLDGSPDRAALLRIAEGLYRARDFAGALVALRRLGELQLSERPYRYYIAVALYETGDYAGAKTELLAALPHIELTPDVERYRAKILGALD